MGAVCRVLDTHLDRYRKLVRRLDKKKVIVDEDWSVLQHCLTANTFRVVLPEPFTYFLKFAVLPIKAVNVIQRQKVFSKVLVFEQV